MRSLAWMLLAIVASVAWPTAAQDLPGRVGRLAWIEGTVAVYQDPDRGWDTAWLNTPLTSENSVWTEPGSRAEVRVGPIAVRLDEASQLDVSRLDDQTLDATLVRGMMAVRVRHFRRGDLLRLSTPQASFLLQGDGRYRLEADADRGESRLTVFTGVARMESASGTLRIPAGQSVVVWGEDRPHYAFQDAFTLEFDRWSLARDERLVERTASRYVSYEMTGYEDLDRYGEWIEEPVYGALWFPTRVAADWAPYRYGRWTYVRPWGWTWVDEAPWGYAPFHYGRWVHLRDRWAWAPGKRVERPTWAPALVGFVGGEGWSATVRSSGGPVVGWYPLAPSEAYRPWYNASPTYVNRVNIVVVNVPERVRQEHREFNRERGTTAVNRETLIAQRPVAQALVPVTRQAAASAPTLARPNTVLPSATEMREARRRTGSETARAPAPPPPAATGSAAPAARGERGRAASAPSAQPAPGANAMARPAFSRPSVAPAPAPQGATPPSPTAPLSRAPSAPGAAPAQRAAQPAPGAQTPQPPPAASQPLGRPGSPQRPERENGKPAPGATPATPAQPSGRGVPATPAVPATPPSAAARGAPSGADVFNPGRARADEAQAQQRAREAQQQQERTSREAQQRAAQEQQQRAAQEQRAREAQQAQQRAAQEQQQRAAQEQQRTREAQQAQQRAAQEQQQRAAQEQQRAREAQQAQQRAAQEQQQRAAQEQRAREAQQAQQRAAQEQQQRAQQGLQRPAPAPATAPEQAQKPQPPQAARPVPPAREKDKDKEKDKDNKDDKPSR